MYVGRDGAGLENNVTVQPRHWYTLSVTHEIFDDSELATCGRARAGCLNYGQLRVYRIATHGAIDAMLDAMIDVPVSAIYARRDAAPTVTEYDAIAVWPLQRLTLSGCDVQNRLCGTWRSKSARRNRSRSPSPRPLSHWFLASLPRSVAPTSA